MTGDFKSGSESGGSSGYGSFGPGSGESRPSPPDRVYSINNTPDRPVAPRRPVSPPTQEVSTPSDVPEDFDQVPPEEALPLIRDMEEATAALRAAQDEINEDNERIREMRRQLFDVQLQLQGLQKAALSGEPIGRTTLDTVYDAVVRVCVIALLGGIIGGPALAAATHGVLAEKIVEGVMAGITAGVSTEAAEAGLHYLRSRQPSLGSTMEIGETEESLLDNALTYPLDHEDKSK